VYERKHKQTQGSEVRRMRWLAGTAALAALCAAAPRPGSAWHQLTEVSGDPTAPVVAAAALAAWALAAWLVLVVLATLATRLPGTAGALAGAAIRCGAPLAVRRGLEAALGLTVAATALGAAPAVAADAVPHAARPAAAVPSLDWPGPAAPSLDWPGAPSAAPATAPPVSAPELGAAQAVVVRPGDSLWAIAAAHLTTPGATPSTAAVARSWPRWWSANRAVIGADPDLIQPGTRLVPPADTSTR